MTTTTSFSNANRLRVLIGHDLGRIKLFTALYTVITFIFLPLQYIFTVYDVIKYYNPSEPDYWLRSFGGAADIYSNASLVFFFITVFYVFIIGAELMKYNYSKRAVDVYYAMPFSRRQFMVSHLISGSIAICFPVILNYAILLIVKAIYVPVGSTPLAIRDCLLWCAVLLFIFATFLMVSALMGNIADATLFTLGVNCTMPFMYTAFMSMASFFVIGFNPSADIFGKRLLHLHPLPMVTLVIGTDQQDWVGPVGLAVWFLIGIAAAVAAVEIFARRDAELAESVGRDNPLKIVEKIVGIFLGANIFALLMVSMLNVSSVDIPTTSFMLTYLLWLVVGAVLMYVVIEVILARNFRTVKSNLWIGASATVLSGLTVVVMGTGLFGFEGKIPNLGNVQNVKISANPISDYASMRQSLNEQASRDIIIAEPENIEEILAMHSDTIEFIQKAKSGDMDYENYDFIYLTLEYQLSNGKTMSRRYNYMPNGAIQRLAKVADSSEVLSQIHPLLLITDENLNSLHVFNSTGSDNAEIAVSGGAGKELLSAVRNDIFRLNGEAAVYEGQPKYYLNAQISYEYKNRYYYLYSSADYSASSATHTVTESVVIPIPDSFSSTISQIESALAEPLKAGDVADISHAVAIMPYGSRYEHAIGLYSNSLIATSNNSLYQGGDTILDTSDADIIARLWDLSETRAMNFPESYLTIGFVVQGKDAVVNEFSDAVQDDIEAIPADNYEYGEYAEFAEEKKNEMHYDDGTVLVVRYVPLSKLPDDIYEIMHQYASQNESSYIANRLKSAYENAK